MRQKDYHFHINPHMLDIKARYPQSRVISEENIGIGISATVFVEERKFSGEFDKARIYALFTPACFMIADVFNGDNYLYSIGTHSGYWYEIHKEMRSALIKLNRHGLNILESIDPEDIALLDDRKPIE